MKIILPSLPYRNTEFWNPGIRNPQVTVPIVPPENLRQRVARFSSDWESFCLSVMAAISVTSCPSMNRNSSTQWIPKAIMAKAPPVDSGSTHQSLYPLRGLGCTFPRTPLPNWACAKAMVPIVPAEINSLDSILPGCWRNSNPTPNLESLDSEALTTSTPSAKFKAIGFSMNTCLPTCRAKIA